MTTTTRGSRKGFTLRGNRSGAAYVLALTTLVVGVTFALAMVDSSSSYFLRERSQNWTMMARDLAEAGADYAYDAVNKHNVSVPYTFPTVSLASGSFSVTVSDGGSATMLITSTGTVKGQSITIQRITKGARLDKIFDNLAPEFSCSSGWTAGTSSVDKYATDYRWHSTGAKWEPATWTVNLPATGYYDIYAWWPKGNNRSTTSPFVISTTTGQVTVNVNMQQNGGKWNLLGRFNMSSGNQAIMLSYWAPTGFVVCADAIRVVGPYSSP